MNIRFTALVALALVVFIGTVQAVPVTGKGTWETTLQPRDLNNDGQADAFYDTALSLTWLRNADVNGTMNWATANAWASSLIVGGHSGWRLPTMFDTGAPGCDYSLAGGTDCGYNTQTKSGETVYSEMAHLWYVTMGNLAYYAPGTGIGPQPGYTSTVNTGDFQNLDRPVVYWLGLPYAPDTNYAWLFYAYSGHQLHDDRFAPLYAMAVHSGDLAPVPEPQPIILWLTALAGFGLATRLRLVASRT